MNRCRENQPRRIVCTRSEVLLLSLHALKCFLTYYYKDVSPEEAARSRSPDALRVRQMNQRINVVTNQHRDAKFRRQRAIFNERARAGLEETDLK